MFVVLRRSILIERPTDEVFRRVADLEGQPGGFPGLEALRPLDELPAGRPGKRYGALERLPVLGERRAVLELVECVPGERIAYHVELPPLQPRVDFELRDVGAGRTRLLWSCRARSTSLPARLGAPLLRGLLARRAEQALENLKCRLETGRETMRAVPAVDFGDPESVLRVTPQAPLPEPSPHDLVIRVVATSVDPEDCARRAGRGDARFARGAGAPPFVLGRDVSGVVACAGSATGRFRRGDAVWAAIDPFRPGACAEFVAVREVDVAAKPANLSHEEAASLPCAALSAWAALVDHAGLDAQRTAGRRVLVHGGDGDVGNVAIQLLKLWGAQVAATGAAESLPALRELGADPVAALPLAGATPPLRDFDVALDLLRGEHEAAALAALKAHSGSRYVALAPPSSASIAAAAVLTRRQLEQRLRHGRRYRWARFAPNGGALAEIGRQVEAGRIHPHIERVLPLEDLAKAHALFESGRARGRIVIRVAEPASDA